MPRVRFKWIATIAATLVLSYLICESSKMQYDSLIHIFWLVFIVMVSCFSIINIVDSNQNSLLFIYLKKYKQHSFFLFASNMFIFALVQRTLILVGADNYFQNAFYVLFFCIVTFVLVIILTFTIAEFLKQMVPKFYYTITVR